MNIAFEKVQEIVKRHAENERKAKEAEKKLLPCPLCGGPARDMEHGVSCQKCGLWLGEGTQCFNLGGRRKVWNTRA